MPAHYTDLWNKFYQDKQYTPWWPSDGVVRFVARCLKRGIRIERALDLGCGSGRHLWLLENMSAMLGLEHSIQAHGLDISAQALELARSWQADRFPGATLRHYDGNAIPYANDQFDMVLSYGVFDHMPFESAVALSREMLRVMRPGAVGCLGIHSSRDGAFGKGQPAGRNEFLLSGDCEKGILQHYFDEDELRSLLKPFSIDEIFLEEQYSLGTPEPLLSMWMIYFSKDRGSP
jgi:SAM-dependent methyltransferase